jgi:hypothetical protein
LRHVIKGCVGAQGGLVQHLAGASDPQFDAFVSPEGKVVVRGSDRSRFTFAKCLAQYGISWR